MPESRRHLAYLSLGSNVDKERNLVRAVRLLAEAVTVKAVSPVFETAPVGRPDQERFLNAAVVVETDLTPDALKHTVLAPIEQRLGRRRSADRNAPRTIDLDLILFDDRVLQLGPRIIPDPELLSRAHLAVPLAEVAPDYVHPVTGQTLKEIAAGIAGQGGIRRRPDMTLPSGDQPAAPPDATERPTS